MVKPNTTILREGRQFEVDANTVTTDTLTDSGDSSAWETLHEAGYETGDFVPILTSNDHNDDSVTASSYTNVSGHYITLFKWDEVIPSGVQGQVALATRINPNGDQIDVRVRNALDDENALELTGTTGSSFTGIFEGPTDYTPTSTSNPLHKLKLQIRNSDGSTSVTIDDTTLLVGFTI